MLTENETLVQIKSDQSKEATILRWNKTQGDRRDYQSVRCESWELVSLSAASHKIIDLHNLTNESYCSSQLLWAGAL